MDDLAPELRRIGATLARLRKRKGLTQEDLAASVGLHYQTVGTHERGEHPMDLLQAARYATALGCTIDALAGHGDDALLSVVRPDTVYILDREAVRGILAAKKKSQVRKWRVEGYRWDAQVRPTDEVVPREVWDATSRQVERHLADLL